LSCNEALAEVKYSSVAFYTRLASDTIEVELVLGSTDDVESTLMVLKSVLVRRVVDDFNLLFSSILHGARVGHNSNSGLELGFPGEMEAELSVVL